MNPAKLNSLLRLISSKVPFHFYSFPDKVNPAYSEFFASPK